MTGLRLRLAAFCCGGVLLTACAGSTDPASADVQLKGLPFQLLSTDGPAVGGLGFQNENSVHVLAASTIADLRTLATAVGDLAPHACDSGGSASTARECWANIPGSTRELFLAIALDHSCHSAVVTTRLHQSHLTVEVAYKDTACRAGSATAVAPTLSLLSLSIDQLPRGVLTVDLREDAQDPTWRTVVDLHQPYISLSAASAYQDVHAALRQIGTVSGGDSQLLGIGFRRWSSSRPDCAESAPNAADDVTGYVLFAKTPGSGDQEYRWASGKLADCGPVSP
jgi:hypothetical protein